MKAIKVENCGECPHCSLTGLGLICENGELRMISEDINPTIPAWCPLEDEKARYVVYNEVEGFKIIEEYDCPINGKLGGIDECPLC